MLLHAREGHVELLGKNRDRSVCTPELLQNAASGGVRKRGERGIEAGLGILNHVVQYIRTDWRHARGAERAVRCRPTAGNGDFDVAMPSKTTVAYILKKAGTVEYYCRLHPNMKATITIAP
jgi:hypothetical protein